jgi:hypothetical protein
MRHDTAIIWRSVVMAAVLSACGAAQQHADADKASRAQLESAIARAEAAVDSCRNVKLRETERLLLNTARNNLALGRDTSAIEMADKVATLMEGCAKLMINLKRHQEVCKLPARIGMNSEQIKQIIWCEPDHINRTTTAGHISEQWVYDGETSMEGYNPPRGYLYLTDGILTAIQER